MLDARITFVLECFDGMGATPADLVKGARRLYSDDQYFDAVPPVARLVPGRSPSDGELVRALRHSTIVLRVRCDVPGDGWPKAIGGRLLWSCPLQYAQRVTKIITRRATTRLS